MSLSTFELHSQNIKRLLKEFSLEIECLISIANNLGVSALNDENIEKDNYSRTKQKRIPEVIEPVDVARNGEIKLFKILDHSQVSEDAADILEHDVLKTTHDTNDKEIFNEPYKSLQDDNNQLIDATDTDPASTLDKMDDTKLDEKEKIHNSDRSYCKLCQKSFKESRTMLRHFKISHGTERFYCDQCPYLTSYKPNLNIHWKASHSEAAKKIIKQCTFQTKNNVQCTFQTTNDDRLTEHVKQRHEKKTFQCTFQSKSNAQCTFQTTNDDRLTKHVELKHEKKTFQCKICEKKFSTKTYQQQHVERVHGSKPELRAYDGEYTRPEKQYKFVCSICKSGFRFRAAYISHKSKHKPVIKYY